MSFGQNVAATKIELLKYKRSSQVASMVRKILDDKRKVLLKNIEEMITEATKARGGIWEPLQDVYKSVNEAYLTLGTNTVDSVAQSAPAVMEVDVKIRRVVDVKIPALNVTEKDTKSMPYGLPIQTPQLIEQQNKSKLCSQKFARLQNMKTQYLVWQRLWKKLKNC